MATKRIVIKLSELRKIAALQCTQVEAAAHFGLSLTRLKKLINGNPKVSAALNEGQEGGKISLRRKQNRHAKSNAHMAIHLGKNYLNQSDKTKTELTGAEGGPIQTADISSLTYEERQQLKQLIKRVLPPDAERDQ